MDTAKLILRGRLSLLFFLTFFVWASWMVPLSSYGPELGFAGKQIGWLFATTAIAAMISPLFLGYVADRFFSTERILFVLHVVGGAALIGAGFQVAFWPLFGLLMLATLCFMPSMALANSLTFANIDDSSAFPRVAVFGTIGWIISGWIVGLAGWETQPYFFFLGGAAEIALGVYCLSLPHTPPKGKEAGGDVLGLEALRLFKNPQFVLFVLAAFLVSIPATHYFVGTTFFLSQTGRPAPAALMTISQFSEIFVMATMPIFIARIGLGRVLALGMLMWMIRYLCFGSLLLPLIILGLLVHGFCYCFVFVGAFIFADTKVPPQLRASAQSFISFVMLGVGWFIGSQVAGVIQDQYPAQVAGVVTTNADGEEQIEALPGWDKLQKVLDTDENGLITTMDLDEVDPQSKDVKDLTDDKYNLSELHLTLEKVNDVSPVRNRGQVTAAVAAQMRISRDDYLSATSLDWRRIWLWPALVAGVVAFFFAMGYRDKETLTPEAEEEAEMPPAGAAAPATPPEAPSDESGPPGEGESPPAGDQPGG